MRLTRNWVALALGLALVCLIVAFILAYYDEHEVEPHETPKTPHDKILPGSKIREIRQYKDRRVHLYHCDLRTAHTARNSKQSVVIYLDHKHWMFKPPVGVAGYSAPVDEITVDLLLNDIIPVITNEEELAMVLPILKEASEYFSGIRVILDFPTWRRYASDLLQCNLVMLG